MVENQTPADNSLRPELTLSSRLPADCQAPEVVAIVGSQSCNHNKNTGLRANEVIYVVFLQQTRKLEYSIKSTGYINSGAQPMPANHRTGTARAS
jgi:hypothetical protein